MIRLILFLTLFSFLGADEPYKNEGMGYSISFPAQWRWQPCELLGLDVVATAPRKNNFASNINIISAKADGETLDHFYQANLEALQNGLHDVKILERGQVILGVEGRKLAYKHSLMGYNLQVVQYFLLKNGISYVITCTSTEADFPTYADTFEKTVRSFTL